MKTLTRLIAIVATTALLGGVTTFADDSQLQNRLAVQRQIEASKGATTIALYGHRTGIGSSTGKAKTAALKVEAHYTPHGTAHYRFVPAN